MRGSRPSRPKSVKWYKNLIMMTSRKNIMEELWIYISIIFILFLKPAIINMILSDLLLCSWQDYGNTMIWYNLGQNYPTTCLSDSLVNCYMSLKIVEMAFDYFRSNEIVWTVWTSIVVISMDMQYYDFHLFCAELPPPMTLMVYSWI